MATPSVSSSSRTVANHQTTPTPKRTPSGPSTPLPAPEYKRIQLSAPTEIPAPIRTSSTFPPTPLPLYNPATPSSSRVQSNGTPPASTSTQHRGVKLDHVAERQANGPPAQGLSAKALGKRKRTEEQEEIIRNAGQVFKDNIDKDAAYFTTDYLPVHPFESGRDIVDRLLPFHLWQIHDQDLDCRPKDAKRSANERVGVEKLVTRHVSLMERLRKAQVRQDDSDTRADIMQITQTVVQSMRDTSQSLQAQLRDVKAEHDRITSEARRREEARRAAQIAAGEKPLPRPGPGRPPGVSIGMGLGTPTMSRTTSTNGGSMPGTPGSVRGVGVQGGTTEVPPGPISVNVPVHHRSELIRLKIIAVVESTRSPGKIISKTKDGQHLILSVFPNALSPSQLNFLAGVLKVTPQGRAAIGSPAAHSPSSPATSAASSPKPVGTS